MWPETAVLPIPTINTTSLYRGVAQLQLNTDRIEQLASHTDVGYASSLFLRHIWRWRKPAIQLLNRRHMDAKLITMPGAVQTRSCH